MEIIHKSIQFYRCYAIILQKHLVKSIATTQHRKSILSQFFKDLRRIELNLQTLLPLTFKQPAFLCKKKHKVVKERMNQT